VLAELSEAYQIRSLSNRYLAGALGVGSALVLAVTQGGGQGGLALWPLFGTSNQLLAGLSLTVVTVWLYRSGRIWIHIAIPMLIVIVLAAVAMLGNLVSYWHAENYLLLSFGTAVLALQLWVVLEGIFAVRRFRAEGPPVPSAKARG